MQPATTACSTSPERRWPGRRCWAVEGAGSYGAGLAAFLQAHRERAVEIGRPARPQRRTGAKTDAIDAARAAREALTHEHPLAPRRHGDREALRVLLATRHSACVARVSAINQLKALIVRAPEELRAELRALGTKQQVRRCASDPWGLRVLGVVQGFMQPPVARCGCSHRRTGR
jgi:transposase